MRPEKEVRKIGNCAHWENRILKANPELIPGSFHLSPSWLNIFVLIHLVFFHLILFYYINFMYPIS